MTRCPPLLRRLCRSCAERTEESRTDDLIDEAERTRQELSRITGRLAAHVLALKALTRAYAQQQHQEEPGRG